MQNSERVSALLDGAGEDDDLTALAEIVRDPEECARWARYQFIGDTLREPEGRVEARFDLAARVHAALAAEPPLQRDTARVVTLPVRTSRRWPGALTGLATAASLAFVAFLGLQSSNSSSPATFAPQAAMTAAEPEVPPAATAVAPPVALADTTREIVDEARDPDQVSTLSPEEYQRRINSYLVNFNEQRAQMGVPGVHPYVRVVGYESTPTP